MYDYKQAEKLRKLRELAEGIKRLSVIESRFSQKELHRILLEAKLNLKVKFTKQERVSDHIWYTHYGL